MNKAIALADLKAGQIVQFYPDDSNPTEHVPAKVRGITGGGRVQITALTNAGELKKTVIPRRIEIDQLELIPPPDK